jgi:hypothetical protein
VASNEDADRQKGDIAGVLIDRAREGDESKVEFWDQRDGRFGEGDWEWEMRVVTVSRANASAEEEEGGAGRQPEPAQ